MRDSFEMPGGQGMPAAPQQSPRRLEGRHVLFILIAFFGVVFAVNGWFLVKALGTHTGLVAVEPYRKGLAYNARIAAGERQAEVGWRDAVEVTRESSIRVDLAEQDGRAVTGLTVTGSIGRPSTAAHDRTLRLAEVEPGRYVATPGALAAGSWIVNLEARASAGDTEPVYRMRRRLWLKP